MSSQGSGAWGRLGSGCMRLRNEHSPPTSHPKDYTAGVGAVGTSPVLTACGLGPPTSPLDL